MGYFGMIIYLMESPSFYSMMVLLSQVLLRIGALSEYGPRLLQLSGVPLSLCS